jgi:carboxymethylenebutenolidase
MGGKIVQIRGHDGAFSGYLATPDGAPKAGLVLIQEIFGVNAVMREIADAYAAQGYAALCPDLFWRLQPNVQLTDKTKAEWDRALALMGAFDVDKGIDDIDATIDYLRDTAGIKKVGAVGFCLGGMLAFLTAARTDVDASVGYYGINLDKRLDEVEKLAQPLLLHIAGKDRFVPPTTQEVVKAGLHNHPRVTIYSYENCDHAFARIGGEHFDKDAADLANRRTADFLRENLAA